jgi:hypothetical protein
MTLINILVGVVWLTLGWLVWIRNVIYMMEEYQ